MHTVVVNGRVVKYQNRLVDTAGLGRARQLIEQTVEYLQGQLGPQAWTEGMHPDIPATTVLDNPYTYTTWDARLGAVEGWQPHRRAGLRPYSSIAPPMRRRCRRNV